MDDQKKGTYAVAFSRGRGFGVAWLSRGSVVLVAVCATLAQQLPVFVLLPESGGLRGTGRGWKFVRLLFWSRVRT